MSNEAKVKVKHDADDTRRMVATKLSVPIESIEHIGFVAWDARHGYVKLCNCQRSILFAVEVHLRFLFAIRDGGGIENMVLHGKCEACGKVYIAEIDTTQRFV